MTAPSITLGRNDRCHCGSGKKYKQCCLDKDEQALRAERAAAAAAAPEEAGETREAPPSESHAKTALPHQKLQQPWNRSPRSGQGFARVNAPRKVGGGG